MPAVTERAQGRSADRGSYVLKFKQDVRRYYGSFVSFDRRGEMIPN